MTVPELQQTYQIGSAKWTNHGPEGLRDSTVQYDLNGNAEHHITLNHNAANVITGVHYSIRNSANVNFHMFYYPDTNTYHVDYEGTRNPKTINTAEIKRLIGDFCVMSHIAVNANRGAANFSFKKFETFKTEQDRVHNAVFDKAMNSGGGKKGKIFINLTGGGTRSYK